jgi:phosphatidate phosphatase APP1
MIPGSEIAHFDRWWNTWNNQSQSRNDANRSQVEEAVAHIPSKSKEFANVRVSATPSNSSSVSSSFRNSGYQETMDRTAWLEEILRN